MSTEKFPVSVDVARKIVHYALEERRAKGCKYRRGVVKAAVDSAVHQTSKHALIDALVLVLFEYETVH